MKNFITIILIFHITFIIAGCKKKATQNQNQQNVITFKINPLYERPYSAGNVKPISNLTVQTAIDIYIQHLKEQVDWNKRITYEINKRKFQNQKNQSNSTSEPRVNENTNDENSGDYGTIFNQTKEKYEKIFFKAIGITQDIWEEFSTKHYQEILNYRQSNPQIEQEIVKYSKLIQEQQRMLNEE